MPARQYAPDHAPLTGIPTRVERSPAYNSVRASELAAAEQAKVVAWRQEKVADLKRFNRELQLRVERAEKEKRAAARERADARALQNRKATDAAKAQAAHAWGQPGVASLGLPVGVTPLEAQRQFINEAAQRAYQMMMHLYEAPSAPLQQGGGGVPAAAATAQSFLRVEMGQAAADRTFAHERRTDHKEVQREEVHAQLEAHEIAVQNEGAERERRHETATATDAAWAVGVVAQQDGSDTEAQQVRFPSR